MIDERKFNRQVDRNLKGIRLEKSGRSDEAILLYEKNVNEHFIGNHPYDRLAIIYRKRKQYDDETRILQIAILVYEKQVASASGVSKEFVSTKLERFKKRLTKALSLKSTSR